MPVDTIGATTLGEILPSSMGPTTLDAVADIVAPKKSAKAYKAHEAAESKAYEKWEHTTKAGKAHEAREHAAMKKAKAPAKTNTGRKNSDGLTIWKGPRGGLFVMKKGKKVAIKK